jgi:hypothetical protein
MRLLLAALLLLGLAGCTERNAGTTVRGPYLGSGGGVGLSR